MAGDGLAVGINQATHVHTHTEITLADIGSRVGSANVTDELRGLMTSLSRTNPGAAIAHPSVRTIVKSQFRDSIGFSSRIDSFVPIS